MPRARHTVAGVSRADETLVDLALARGTLDREGALRKDGGLLARLLRDRDTRVLELTDSAARTSPTVPTVDGSRLQLRGPEPEDAGRLAMFLGSDASGTAYLAVVTGGSEGADGAPSKGARPSGGEPAATFREQAGATLREVGVRLSARDAGLFTTAQALANWHAAHTHCPRCGALTEPAEAGWTRRCTADSTEHYPRTDPAVIMSVLDDHDRLLLARAPQWPAGRVSVLAGFVEPGEPLEAAVAREVREEVGIAVTDVRYLGNQPWPFPASLMVGFSARALDTELLPDQDEIAEARWWSRSELAAAVGERTVLLSPRLSIARRLIEHWYGGPLGPPGEPEWVRG
jgi:NAD+ diphosphatase